MYRLGVFCCLILIGIGEAHGEMIMTLTGTPGSSIIHWSVSGSDTATASFGYGVCAMFGLDVTDGFDPFPSGMSGGDYGRNPLASGGGTVSNLTDGVTEPITGITLQDSDLFGVARFGARYEGTFHYGAGDVFSWQGSGTIDLSSRGVTFDDLTQGTGDARTFLDGRDMGIVGRLVVRQVPEPTSIAFAVSAVFSLAFYGLHRRRR